VILDRGLLVEIQLPLAPETGVHRGDECLVLGCLIVSRCLGPIAESSFVVAEIEGGHVMHLELRPWRGFLDSGGGFLSIQHTDREHTESVGGHVLPVVGAVFCPPEPFFEFQEKFNHARRW